MSLFAPPITPWREEEKERIKEFPSPEDVANTTQFMMFSPFVMPVDSQLEQALIVLVALKLAKTPEGLKVLRDLGVQYLKTVGKIVGELESSSSSNWMTAIVNQHLCNRICRRLGLISAAEAASIDARYAWIYNTNMLKSGITETFTALGNFFKGAAPLISGLPT